MMQTFPCGCQARTQPSSDGGLIVYEFIPVCPDGKAAGMSIRAVRAHFQAQGR